ncbi:type IV secretion system protein [Cupriavidus basilensis]|uniref:type IV secretion system protein n=1 Tax=Cupriavidus basilensis TaxID=68895 RepID=UPI0007514F08|nr:type IV secretion system protein [Cupriavidus basilensis]
MKLFSKKSDQTKAVAVAPGMYAGESPEKLIFDRTTRIVVDRNHWKIATFVAAVLALAAIMTREAPPSVVKVVGVSSDATGKPITRELESYVPQSLQLQWAFKDLVMRMYTIEPILTPQIEDSRMSRTLRTVRDQMIGSARDQFQSWVDDDAPFRAISASPTLVREPKVTNIAVLPDNTVVVEFITTTTEDGFKPRRQRYAITFRYQVKPPQSDAALGPNPFGIYPVFFSIQKSAV